jgi:formate-dependent nitrite reductase cytochrome c552 subunit
MHKKGGRSMKKLISLISCSLLFFFLGFSDSSSAEAEPCINCHRGVTPGLVKDWEASKHSKKDVTCSTCHGNKHTGSQNVKLALLPDEHLCAQCHKKQFDEFAKGKHNFGWTSLNALPITHGTR